MRLQTEHTRARTFTEKSNSTFNVDLVVDRVVDAVGHEEELQKLEQRTALQHRSALGIITRLTRKIPPNVQLSPGVEGSVNLQALGLSEAVAQKILRVLRETQPPRGEKDRWAHLREDDTL